MINDLIDVWEASHECWKIEAIDSTWWLGWDRGKGRSSEKYSKDDDTQAESKVDSLRLSNMMILSCELVPFFSLSQGCVFLRNWFFRMFNYIYLYGQRWIYVKDSIIEEVRSCNVLSIFIISLNIDLLISDINWRGKRNWGRLFTLRSKKVHFKCFFTCFEPPD